MDKINIGILYLSLHNLLIKKVGENNTIDRKSFFTILGKHFLVPKNIRCVIIKEMETKKLIKKENSQTIKVLKTEWNLNEDVGKFYKDIGLY